MKPTTYSEKVLDHFRNPRNVGALKGKNVAKGKVGNPVCGDLMEFTIKVKDKRIHDIKFKTFGCGSAVATASMITELAKGKTIEEALKITRKDVADELDGLPPIKMHCSNLAADALRDAIKNYLNKQKIKTEAEKDTKGDLKVIPGEKEFLNNGVYHEAKDLSLFKKKRTLVVDTGKKSLELALALSEYSQRIVFLTPFKTLTTDEEFKTKIEQSNVKVLYESQLLEITGLNTVEKVKIHDLNEDNKYELFVDSVVIV